MHRLLWAVSGRIRYVRHFMPTNFALNALRTRRGLKWGAAGGAAGRSEPARRRASAPT